MSVSLVDQIIVKLGLDTRDFTKGEKEIAASVLRTKKTVENAGREMSQSTTDALNQVNGGLGSLIKRAAVLALVIKALKFVATETLNASRGTRQLGLDARSYDIAASKLRNLQNVAEMFGGTAEDVTKSVAGFEKAIFNMAYNGEVSDSVKMLSRLGVQFQDSAGHARDFKDVFLDTSEAIKQAQDNGTMTSGEAFQFLSQAGFDPGLARAALGGRAGAEAELARQEKRHQVSDEDLGAANANERAITSTGQAYEAAGVIAQRKASGLITGGAAGLEHTINLASGQESPGEVWNAWTKAAEPATMALGDLADATKDVTAGFMGWLHRIGRGTGERAYHNVIQDAAKKHGLDPQVLTGVIGTESGFNPDAISSAGAVGVAQFMPKTAASRGFTAGKDPDRDIEEAARYLAELRQNFKRTGSDDDDAMDKALEAYNAGERRVRSSNEMTPGGPSLSGETLAYPGKVYEYAESARSGGGASTTNVDIGEVNVHTQATDAAGMAEGAAGALNRKLTAAHAEQGMQ